MQKVYEDPTLPYSKESRFEKPTQLSVEIDCEEYEKNNQNNNFNQL